MDDCTRLGFLAHAMLPVYERRINEARGYIQSALGMCENPYVAYSAGKDSSVLLHLVCEQIPTVDAQILTGGESRVLHNDLDTILEWWHSYTQVNLIEVYVDAGYTNGVPFSEMYEQFTDGWTRYLHDKGHDGVFIGLRREESGNRARMINRFGAIHRYSEDRRDARAGTILCNPICNLQTIDVMAYLAKNEIPTFNVYETGNERTKTRLGKTAMGLGQMSQLRMRDPAAFNEITNRFPELRRQGG